MLRSPSRYISMLTRPVTLVCWGALVTIASQIATQNSLSATQTATHAFHLKKMRSIAALEAEVEGKWAANGWMRNEEQHTPLADALTLEDLEEMADYEEPAPIVFHFDTLSKYTNTFGDLNKYAELFAKLLHSPALERPLVFVLDARGLYHRVEDKIEAKNEMISA